jgi:hypothetical protein
MMEREGRSRSAAQVGGKTLFTLGEMGPAPAQRVPLSNGQLLNMLREGEVEYIDANLSIEHCPSVLSDMELIRE